MAAIAPAPTATASCIACARNRTSGSATDRVRAPAATSAAQGVLAGGLHGRLGVRREFQLVPRTLADQTRHILTQRVAGLLQRVRDRGIIRPAVEHAHGLRTLTGEDEGKVCHRQEGRGVRFMGGERHADRARRAGSRRRGFGTGAGRPRDAVRRHAARRPCRDRKRRLKDIRTFGTFGGSGCAEGRIGGVGGLRGSRGSREIRGVRGLCNAPTTRVGDWARRGASVVAGSVWFTDRAAPHPT